MSDFWKTPESNRYSQVLFLAKRMTSGRNSAIPADGDSPRRHRCCGAPGRLRERQTRYGRAGGCFQCDAFKYCCVSHHLLLSGCATVPHCTSSIAREWPESHITDHGRQDYGCQTRKNCKGDRSNRHTKHARCRPGTPKLAANRLGAWPQLTKCASLNPSRVLAAPDCPDHQSQVRHHVK